MHTKTTILPILTMAMLLACAKTDKDQTARENAVSDAVETQISVINNATSDINTGNQHGQ